MLKNKTISIIIITLIYLVTSALTCLVISLLPLETLFIKLLVGDLLWTVLIYLFSLIFKNASIYDPYWSVSPVVMATIYFIMSKKFTIINYVTLTLVVLWGVRLTLNWARRFKSLETQDWRYTMLKEKSGKFYFLVNLFGIHLFPTCIVFFAMLPLFEIFNYTSWSIMSIVGCLITLIAIVIAMLADRQLDLFKKNSANTSQICNKGLWKKSRHPNYFGEVLFWFGIYLIFFSIPNLELSKSLILITSPLGIFLLFEFISIPMMDKHMCTKYIDYKKYMEITNPLLIFFAPNNKK